MTHKAIKRANRICPSCQGLNFTKKSTTYPIKMFDGKLINIGRVSVHECNKCNHLIPTKAGEEKIGRCMATMAITLF